MSDSPDKENKGANGASNPPAAGKKPARIPLPFTILIILLISGIALFTILFALQFFYTRDLGETVPVTVSGGDQKQPVQDDGAPVYVTGDFNDFAFADTLAPLHAAGLFNLTDTLPETQRYTYNHEGNLQALDHMFVSPGLRARGAPTYRVVHVNADFSDAVSDHDPGLLRFELPAAGARPP